MRGTFGLNDFRPGQEEVISSIISGRDTKSLRPNVPRINRWRDGFFRTPIAVGN